MAGAQELADILPIGIAILNHRDESILVNRRFRELMACHNAKSFQCWSQSIHPEDYDRVATAYFEALKSKHALRIEYRIRNQKSLWRGLMLAPLENTDLQRLNLGDDVGFICTIADITLEKTAELQQMEIAHEAQERKQQQERFIDMISHEVRNPLSAILHCTEDIFQTVKDKEGSGIPLADIAQAARTISLCIAHQKRIVDDVLTFSKLDASMLTLSPRRAEPKRHLAKSLSIFRPELRKQDIEFEYKLDNSYAENGIEWVMADLDRVSQVLINLVSNAIKFTSKANGKRGIRVSMGASTDRPPSYPPNVVFFDSSEAAMRLDATNKPEWGNGQVAYVMVAVKDTGIGISDEAQKRLFERFHQATPRTESTYGGSGLGLTVSRKLCHLHGGEIGVSSKEGQGSTFGFFFKVRREVPPFNDGQSTSHGLEIDELCSGIQALSNEATGVTQRTRSPEISDSPVVTRIEEVAPGAPSDERVKHTSDIARRTGSAGTAANNHTHQSLHGDCDKESVPASPGVTKPNLGGGQIKHTKPISPRSDRERIRRILVVEDNDINRQILIRKLQSLGFHVTEAINGREALDALQHEDFDCVLMDQEMPVMDGISATKAIRDSEKHMAHVPVLGVTANARAAQQTEMLDAGMDDIIHKPYRTNDLFEKINQLIVITERVK
ncbi:uncharacterized protein N7515_004593 [Penicillium bovifimosum]|uniref:histidine kinase n=1 Tax=Penicillium bovifimosum TaxID=126998 RepID=A0A9W9L2K4_9EURO|nr:uncharacterized protein N7515_004593 [Penicillium bovifimosum]KAJ5135315.1 hypothetical protein N7515_004593 [Penicillium bovifimosum]